MTNQAPKQPRIFYRTGPMPCPYVAGLVERNLFTELRGAGAHQLHDQLTLAGFRRSHHIVYRPACPQCTACQPVRVLSRDFSTTRSLRRVAARNADLAVSIRQPLASQEQFALFTHYQRSRHNGGEMAAMTFADYRAMVEDTAVETQLVEFHCPGQRLIAAILVDRLCDGISAVYSFFDPDAMDRSLGTYMILWLIEQAKAANLPYVYLGYWIQQSTKMAYKMRFQPLETLRPEGWRRLDPA